jgi:hypothetical protein
MRIIMLFFLIIFGSCSTSVKQSEPPKDVKSTPTCIYDEIVVQPKPKFLIKEPPCFKDLGEDLGMMEEVPCPNKK